MPDTSNSQPMLEVRIPEEIAEAYRRVMSLEIPGFVIRAAYGMTLDEMQKLSITGAEQASGRKYDIKSDLPFGVSSQQGRDVGWHRDSPPSDEDSDKFHVHTTYEGVAKVELANDRGETNNEVHHAYVKANDTVVFRVSGKKPTWHNVESQTETRQSHVAVLGPQKTKPVEPDNDPD